MRCLETANTVDGGGTVLLLPAGFSGYSGTSSNCGGAAVVGNVVSAAVAVVCFVVDDDDVSVVAEPLFSRLSLLLVSKCPLVVELPPWRRRRRLVVRRWVRQRL
jgi:hypothetical protein